MSLKFTIDPATGVVMPPVTVFNGGKRTKSKSKRKTRKGKGRKARKTLKHRR